MHQNILIWRNTKSSRIAFVQYTVLQYNIILEAVVARFFLTFKGTKKESLIYLIK